MKDTPQLEARIREWTNAGLIDAEAGARILAYQAGQEKGATLRGPILIALVFGGILLAAGITLFVAAHWAELSPAARFSLVLIVVGAVHLGGAGLAGRFPALSSTLHALGTVALGAAIFLAAQIFNLHENFATGVLLWAMGAAAGYLLLRDWSQAALLALLAPAWLVSEWAVATQGHSGGGHPLAVGLVLTALTFLSARMGDQASSPRRALVWIGGLALLPTAGVAIGISMAEPTIARLDQRSPLLPGSLAAAWIVALAGPLVLAWALRGREAWINLAWAAWTCAVVLSASREHSFSEGAYHQSFGATLVLYALCAIGSAGLVVWGLREKRKERLNLGIAAFAISVMFFYFDSFMDKLGRSASLLVLGLLCLGGGYVLEMTRRRLTAQLEASR